MIFGMPRAVFPALGVGLFGGGAGVVGSALRRSRGRALVGLALHGLVQPGAPPGPGHRRLRRGVGDDHRRVRRHPRAVDRIDAAGHGRSGRRGLGGVPPGGAAAGRPRTPPGHACRGRSSPWWPVAPAWVTPRPAWPLPSAARSSRCGRVDWRVWSGWRCCCGGSPSLARRRRGPEPEPARCAEAVAEATSELGEGEPL